MKQIAAIWKRFIQKFIFNTRISLMLIYIKDIKTLYFQAISFQQSSSKYITLLWMFYTFNIFDNAAVLFNFGQMERNYMNILNLAIYMLVIINKATKYTQFIFFAKGVDIHYNFHIECWVTNYVIQYVWNCSFNEGFFLYKNRIPEDINTSISNVQCNMP